MKATFINTKRCDFFVFWYLFALTKTGDQSIIEIKEKEEENQ